MVRSPASMMRYGIGSVLALLGAAAAVWSPFRPWYSGTHGHDYGFTTLFDGFTGDKSALIASVFLPMLVAAVLAVVGVLTRSRLLVLLAGLIALATVVLWMIQQSKASDGLSVGGADGMNNGVWIALGGALAMLLGAGVMGKVRKAVRARGRHRRGMEGEQRTVSAMGGEPTTANGATASGAMAGGAMAGGGAVSGTVVNRPEQDERTAAERAGRAHAAESAAGSEPLASVRERGHERMASEPVEGKATTVPVGEPVPTDQPIPDNVRILPERGPERPVASSRSAEAPDAAPKDSEQTADGSAPPRRGDDQVA